jgi:hypothetical protein
MSIASGHWILIGVGLGANGRVINFEFCNAL